MLKRKVINPFNCKTYQSVLCIGIMEIDVFKFFHYLETPQIKANQLSLRT